MADMFGGPVGESQFLADRARGLNSAMNAEETLAKIASVYPAQARLANATAGKLEAESAELAGMAEVLKDVVRPGTTPTGEVLGRPAASRSPGQILMDAAVKASERGYSVAARKLLEDASQAQNRESEIASRGVTQQLNHLKIVKENAELQGQLFDGVKSADEFARAQELYEFQTGLPSPYRGMQYSPETIKAITTASISAKDRITQEETALHHRRTEAYRNARLGQHDTNIRLREAELALREAQERRLARDGGGRGSPAAGPTTEERAQIKRYMRQDGIDTDAKGFNVDSLNSTAYSIASRAREMQRENRALGREQAMRRAYDEAKAAGDLGTYDAGGTMSKDVRFQGRLPAQAQSQLKEGFNTQFGNGQVWTLKDGKPQRIR